MTKFTAAKKIKSMDIISSVKKLATVLKNQNASQEEIEEAKSLYSKAIKETENEEEIAKSMKYLTPVFSVENIENGAIAAMICGAIVEHDYSSDYIIDDYITFFKETFNKTKKFIAVCEKEIQRVHVNEIEENDYEVVERLEEELKEEMSQEIEALNALNQYYQCGIAIFSSDIKAFYKGKEALSFVSEYSDYAVGLLWLSKLFDVLFNEELLVIDLHTKKGISGQMSGIVDNFQLQLLLMGMKELNEKVELSQEMIEIVTGHNEQQSLGRSIPGKWNMCNWEYLRDDDLKTGRESDDWIWSEGKPKDISLFKGKRVILLDNASYQRGLPVQRTFDNLVAEIKIEKVLNESEVEAALKEIKAAANEL